MLGFITNKSLLLELVRVIRGIAYMFRKDRRHIYMLQQPQESLQNLQKSK